MTEPPMGRRSLGVPAPLRVLYVCTANISRSPYAERRSRQAVGAGSQAGITFASTGTPGFPDRGMDPEMGALLLARGADASGHVSRAVDEELMARADLVLTFEFSQHMRLLDAFPAHRDVILGLRQAALAVGSLDDSGEEVMLDAVDRVTRLVGAAQPNSMSLDVEDPYHRGPRVARACADEIDALLDVLLPHLAGRALAPLAVPASEPQRRRPGWRSRPTKPRRAVE